MQLSTAMTEKLNAWPCSMREIRSQSILFVPQLYSSRMLRTVAAPESFSTPQFRHAFSIKAGGNQQIHLTVAAAA